MDNSELSELEALRLEKKALAQRIKELEHENWGSITCGDVKLDREIFGVQRVDRWYVAVNFDTERICGRRCRPKSWKKIIDGRSREEVIDQIPNIIRALQEIYNQRGNQK